MPRVILKDHRLHMDPATVKPQSLQELVDEHTILGMTDGEVESHLCEMHQISIETLLPCPSLVADASRNSLKLTGMPTPQGLLALAVIGYTAEFAVPPRSVKARQPKQPKTAGKRK